MYLWAEICGFIALALSIISFQIKSPRLVLWVMIAPCMLWVIHFLILDQITGLVITIAAIARNLCAATLPDSYMPYVMPICLIPCFIITGITMNGFEDALPLMAGICIAIGAYMRNNPFMFRLANASGETSWLFYAIAISSLSLSITSLFIIGSILVSMARYDLKFNFNKITVAR